MTQLKQALIRFALCADARIVHIDEVDNGAACACHCPSCDAPLLAKNKGTVREHHFAHLQGAGGPQCAESALHLAAKQVLADQARLYLPAGLPGDRQAGVRHLDTVLLEQRLQSLHGEVIVDALTACEDVAFAVEVAVTHFIDAEKARRLRALALPTLEIDLSGLAGDAWTWRMLSEQVLEAPGNRRWLPDELPLGELPCAEVPKAEAVPAELEPAKEFDRWQIPVGPGYARVTRFSSGDHSIWHPSHATTVRKIVQRICTGRGYWNRDYQNWVVFRPFIQQVFEELARSVQPQSIGLEQSYAKSRL